MAEVDIRTTGMHCHSCIMLIQMNVGDLEGVEKVEADLASGVTHVLYDPDRVTVEQIVKEIESTGYGAQPL